jgi:histidyl-tRNA synthetase
LIAVGAPDEAVMLKLAHELRHKGLNIEYGLHFHAIRKQFELASARKAPFAAVIGPQEREQGAVLVRDMGTGREEPVAWAGLADYLTARRP